MQSEKIQIFGTFGPACKKQEILEEMIKAGMTGMRLNLSHTTLEKSMDYIKNYKMAASKQKVEPQILIDMQGPELRVGDMEEVELQTEEVICLVENKDNTCLDNDKLQAIKEIPMPSAVISALKNKMEILLDDGRIRIVVLEVWKDKATARVVMGGFLKPHKSIKIVGVDVRMPVLTEHDKKNLRKAKEYGVTALMQPFVFSGKDLRQVKEILKQEKAEDVQIFAKIENCKGVENLEDILTQADMIVIARGDLGNDMPLWELPGVQKEIEAVCKKNHKPYMVVTQMLASMEHNPIPTRAEVSDIFHAVYYGAEAVMVTGETAVGKYPIEVIRYLANTAKNAMTYKNTADIE